MIYDEEMQKKKDQQMKYKQMLDEQKSIKDTMKMYGNMTSEEKRMNKEDLYAWKIYDNN